MSSASQGRVVEWAVRDDLRGEAGYFVIRAAGSKGPCDLVAIKADQVLLISVKRTTPPGPAERARLLEVAGCLPCIALPIVALGPASRVTYRRLTGHGPADWEPWTPDEIGARA